MKLDILIGENRFIVAPGRQDSPLDLPTLEFGNVRPVELRAWEKSQTGNLVAVDLSAYQISLLIGKPNTRPTLGFWQLTTTRGVSLPITSRATAEEARWGLRGAFGACFVKGGNGSYIVTVAQAGIWALPSASFQGNTLSNVLVFPITPGTATTPAQYRIEVLEVAPARVIPAGWAPGSTVAVNSFTQVAGSLWSLVLSPLADNGFFNLTVDTITTDFIDFNRGAYAIAIALNAAGKSAEVIPDNLGGYWVKFGVAPAACSVEGNLVVLPYSKGNLDLTSSGVRELLDGLQFTSVKLAVILVKDGVTSTVACSDVMLQMGVNQPAVITIDAPQMAGLTFAISDDQAYLLVYQNAILIGEVALNAP